MSQLGYKIGSAVRKVSLVLCYISLPVKGNEYSKDILKPQRNNYQFVL